MRKYAIAVAASITLGGLLWLGQPQPLEECVAKVVHQDQMTDRDNAWLVSLGKATQLEGNGQVPLSRTDFMGCTRSAALSWAGPSEDIKRQAFKLLRRAPSFEYGRQLAMLPPSLDPASAQATARLMRAATSLAEGYHQARNCPAVGGAQREKALADFEMLAEPYLTAIVWNMQLAATTEAAHQDAQNIFVATSAQVAKDPVACDDARFDDELNTLRQFQRGELRGLPCSVALDSGEPVLKCN